MPSVKMIIHWPDGDKGSYFSPSTIVYDHFRAGEHYPQSQFRHKIDAALAAASERVRACYGYPCSTAAAELQRIHSKLEALQRQGVDAAVEFVEFRQ